MSKLILARHGETTFNAAGKWTGRRDAPLTERGFKEARRAGKFIASETNVINSGHYSMASRTFKTLMTILGEVECCPNIDIQGHYALNERDYGDYTSRKKAEVRAEVGEEEFLNIRRGWDHEIPGGESLKDVHDKRVVPFHEKIIVPELALGKTALVVSSNNPLRAYVKHLEGIPDEKISAVELGTAEVRIYDFDSDLQIVGSLSKAIGDVH